MTEQEFPPPPVDLGARGAAYWTAIQQEHELDASSTEVLVELCRLLDRLESLQEVIARDGVTSSGSTGQLVVHPALLESRQMQAQLPRLVSALGLPPTVEDELEFERWKTERAKKASMVAHGYLRAVR